MSVIRNISRSVTTTTTDLVSPTKSPINNIRSQPIETGSSQPASTTSGDSFDGGNTVDRSVIGNLR